MKLPRRNFLHLAAGAAAVPAALRFARAQAYPSRPVRCIVGYAPGGGTDIFVRLVGKTLPARLGQPFVIENRGSLEQYRHGGSHTGPGGRLHASWYRCRGGNQCCPVQQSQLQLHPRYGLGWREPRRAFAQMASAKSLVHVVDLTAQQSYIEGDPGVVDAVELGGVRTLLMVPMLKKSALMGALAIYRQKVRPSPIGRSS
jgi:hypothetical protein